VLDARDEEIGRVQLVRMGDLEALTDAGNDRRPTELVGKIAESVMPGEAEPDVPEPLQSRLRRSGYLEIDGPGLADTDRYASSEHVREVSGEAVRLDLRKDQLAVEA
jgi:hypothetical protein